MDLSVAKAGKNVGLDAYRKPELGSPWQVQLYLCKYMTFTRRERFQAKREPVPVKKMRQNRDAEPIKPKVNTDFTPENAQFFE
jgi:hypothetical protein